MFKYIIGFSELLPETIMCDFEKLVYNTIENCFLTLINFYLYLYYLSKVRLILGAIKISKLIRFENFCLCLYMELKNEKKPKNIGNYTLGKTIGQGTFGKVKLGTHTLTDEKVAVKILEKERIKDVADVERVAREIHILKLIRHPNIIQLYEVILT